MKFSLTCDVHDVHVEVVDVATQIPWPENFKYLDCLLLEFEPIVKYNKRHATAFTTSHKKVAT